MQTTLEDEQKTKGTETKNEETTAIFEWMNKSTTFTPDMSCQVTIVLTSEVVVDFNEDRIERIEGNKIAMNQASHPTITQVVLFYSSFFASSDSTILLSCFHE